MDVTAWTLIQPSLEQGEIPKGMVAVVPNIDKMLELQSLAMVHQLQCKLVLIAKGEEADKEKLVPHPSRKRR